MQLDIKNKKVIVTGAAQGIGLAITIAFKKSGANVLAVDIDQTRLNKLAKKHQVHTLKADLSKPNIAKQVGAKAAKKLSGVDVLVNNVGIIPQVGDVEKITQKVWDKVIDTNLNSAFWCVQGCIKYLAKSKAPSIINITSSQATHGQPENSPYCAAKGGLANLTRALAIDLAEKNIRVNAVAPGFINTQMAIRPDGRHEHKDENFKKYYLKQRKIILGRPGQPEDVTGPVLFFASSASSYITGQSIVVDGGLLATY